MRNGARPAPPDLDLRRVLVVDDDPVVRAILATTLEEGGFLPIMASTAEDALRLVEEEQIRLVILDWLLPGDVDGLEVCRRIRAIDATYRIHVLIITAQSGRRRPVQALEAGADDFVPKPFDDAELIARVRNGRRLLQMEHQLVQQMLLDELTGLPSRRAFKEAVSQEWYAWRRYGYPFSCAILDVDFFKSINDAHGHDVGDEVLQQLGQLLRGASRDCDKVFRYGGEEFVAILPNTDQEGATIWAERVCGLIRDHRFTAGDAQLAVTASVGVAESVSCMEGHDKLIHAADQCLLAAKSRGRNQVVNFVRLAERPGGSSEASNRDPSRFDGVCISEAMAPLIHSLTPSTSLAQAADYLRCFRISSAPVVDEDGALAGLVSEKDLLMIGHVETSAEMTVKEVMRRGVAAFEQDTPLANVLALMQQTPFRSVFVTADGQPVGVVTRGTLLGWCAANIWSTGDLDASDHVAIQLSGVLSAAAEVAATAERLQSEVSAAAAAGEDPAAALVAGASRIEYLLQDLLAATPALQA